MRLIWCPQYQNIVLVLFICNRLSYVCASLGRNYNFFFSFTYHNLPTYLIGHYPTNGFRSALTHASRRHCFQSMTGIPRIGPNPRIKCPTSRSILLHSNERAKPAQPLGIYTLHNVIIVEGLIYLIVGSDRPKILRRTFLSNALNAALSIKHWCMLNRDQVSTP